MLKLNNINKQYIVSSLKIDALKDVDLEFRDSEFVSILGQSGSGKTTLLNIIGGLDRYTSGDLVVSERSTKDFNNSDWDSYRNGTVGFVFQSYNLIPHLSVLGNVEIALTLSGVSKTERKRRALTALNSVGIADQANKKPNQLSGGQMQRVAIARALVNNPKIILADEPTGALDSATSVQIMEILKEVSKERLVIMVTHNNEAAEAYSSRIIRLKDGKVISDSLPYHRENSHPSTNKLNCKPQKSRPFYKRLSFSKVFSFGKKKGIRTEEKSDTALICKESRWKKAKKQRLGNKSSMSFVTALKLSFRNLLTKKTRTIITSVAASIGIIGVGLVMAISSGTRSYIGGVQSETMARMPITMARLSNTGRTNPDKYKEYRYTDKEILIPYDSRFDRQESQIIHQNPFGEELDAHLEKLDPSLYNSISYVHNVHMRGVGQRQDGTYNEINLSEFNIMNASANFRALPPSDTFVKSLYDELYGHYPTHSGEVVLILDSENRVDISLLQNFGIEYELNTPLSFDDIVGYSFKVLHNDTSYEYDEEHSTFTARTDYEELYHDENNKTLTVSGIIRINRNATSGFLNRGIGYLPSLTSEMLASAEESQIVQTAKANPNKIVVNYKNQTRTFTQNAYHELMVITGGDTVPSAILIYPATFEAKEGIKAHLNTFNIGKSEDEELRYNDPSESIIESTSRLIDTVSFILTAFASISLVVSSIMIGIITYVSVIERTKEIGILRSIGARRIDISRVFNAETVIIGFTAGVLGVILTYALSVPANNIIYNQVDVEGIAKLPFSTAFILIGVSMLLTFIAGIIPSYIAAKKDPVVALRSE
ncbi:MAG: ATP-binding cassette domain-containing protein [Clostridia bacterium]